MKSKMLKFLGLCVFLASLMFLSGCAYNVAPDNAGPDWYNVTGTGVAPEGMNPAQARLMAKQAAVSDARRQLLETAKGVAINSHTTVENFMTQNDYIRSRVDGIIRMSPVLDTRYNNDGTCEVDMRIDLNQICNVVR